MKKTTAEKIKNVESMINYFYKMLENKEPNTTQKELIKQYKNKLKQLERRSTKCGK